MKEIIELLNQTSPERTFFYVVAFVTCFIMACIAIMDVFGEIARAFKRK